MPTIAVVGEVVADAVLPPDGIVNGAAHLTVHPGGGPANTAVALSRLGTRARFAGRLSGGALGALCRAKLEESLVDLSASENASEPATLAIARLDATGAASYEFYTDGTADWAWTDESLAPLIDGPFAAGTPPVAIHTGTLALALQPSGQVIENLLARARAQLTVSIDPNLRTLLVPVASYRLWIDRWAGAGRHRPVVRGRPGAALARLDAGAGGGPPARPGSPAGSGQPGRRRRVRLPARRAGPGTDRSHHAGGHRRRRRFLPRRAAALPGGEPVTSAAGWRRSTVEGLTAALTFASRVSAITCSRAGANPPWAAELS